MIKIFQYNNDTGQVELATPELLLIKEFKALLSADRNKCPEDKKGTKYLRAFKEFTYIWLAIDWMSIYSDYVEGEKHELALSDSGLTQEEFDDPTFRAACRKYRDIQDSNKDINLLKSAKMLIDKFTAYFQNIDPEERDPETNKPIWKVKDLMQEMSQLSSVSETLKGLEQKVMKGLTEQATLRGNYSDGYLPKKR